MDFWAAFSDEFSKTAGLVKATNKLKKKEYEMGQLGKGRHAGWVRKNVKGRINSMNKRLGLPSKIKKFVGIASKLKTPALVAGGTIAGGLGGYLLGHRKAKKQEPVNEPVRTPTS